MTHTHGEDSPLIHQLAWDAFRAGTDTARAQGLYGAGQDLLKDAFSGNVKGMGPAVAEMEFDERAAEPFLFFAADKTDPGAYNLPLYLAFVDPMNTPGLILSPKIASGFRFVIMDVSYTEAIASSSSTRPKISTTSPRSCVIPSVTSSSPSGRAPPASRLSPSPPRASTTSQASTPAKTIQSCSFARR